MLQLCVGCSQGFPQILTASEVRKSWRVSKKTTKAKEQQQQQQHKGVKAVESNVGGAAVSGQHWRRKAGQTL